MMMDAIARIDDRKGVIMTLEALIIKSAQVQGIAKTDKDVSMLAATLYDYIIHDDYYGNLTGEEIAEVFRLGSIGKLGDAYGVTVKTFCAWMDEYRETALEHRRQAEIAERIRESKAMAKQLSRGTPQQALQAAITKAYKAYKAGEQVFDFGGCLRREIERREGRSIDSLEDYFRTCITAPNFNDNPKDR